MGRELGWRCVVTAHDADGQPVFQSDESLHELETAGTASLGRLLSLPERARSVDDGVVDAVGTVTGPGSLTVDALVVGPTHRPGEFVAFDSGSSELFEAYVMVQGHLQLVVGTDETVLRPGDVFLPRGRPHGIRTSASEEARLVRVRCVVNPSADVAVPTTVRSASGPPKRVRRVVAGTDAMDRPVIVQDGDPEVMFVLGEESNPDVGLADVWELGGPVRSVAQGGDAPDPWELEPRANGMKVLNLEMKPVEDDGPPDEHAWHATSTIDIDIVVDGSVEMYLPNVAPVTLRPGDTLIQRGTDHVWRVIGTRSLRMVTVMLGVQARPLPAAAP